MSEENSQEEQNQGEAQETKEQEGSGNSQLSYEDLQKELTKVRREAANRRVLTREQEAQLSEYEKWKQSQMSETEKAQQRIADLEKERLTDAVEIAQTKFNLEDEDLEFLKGTTKEEILASAKKLADRLGRTKDEGNGANGANGGNPNLFPGTRGTPVGSGSQNDANDYLRKQLRGEV